jgi:hypothetical protein
LSVGTHKIVITAAAPSYGIAYNVTFNLTVTPQHKDH